jgi:hypothetical protein
MNFRMRLAFSMINIFLALNSAISVYAVTVQPVTLAVLTASAGRIFRGECLAAEVETTEVAGARIVVTRYTFRVNEYLKGKGPSTITFRQVGTPQGGPRDLGGLAGIPVYTPGREYVLFLLPESSAGLTSPAGVKQGVFVVSGNQVTGILAAPTTADALAQQSGQAGSTPSVVTMTYDQLRRAVLDHVSRPVGK